MPKDPYQVMDMKQLRCFWSMAKALSFTRASIELGIAQSAVSQQVRKLEVHLGIKLYEARGGRVRLTPAGRRTFELAVSAFEQFDEFERAVAHADESIELTLCASDDVLRYLLPDVVKAFARAHPLAKLRLLARSMQQSLQMVRSNEADVAVVARRDGVDDLDFELVATYPGCIILHKGHPLGRVSAERFWASLDEPTVRRYPLIIFEGQRDARALRDALAALDLPLVVGYEVTTHDTLKYYVRSGVGVAAVSALCITKEDEAHLDIIEAPPELGGQTSYYLAVRPDKYRSPPLMTLLELVRREGGSTRG